MKIIYPLQSTKIGLQFFTRIERGWPEGKFTAKILVEGIRKQYIQMDLYRPKVQRRGNIANDP